MEYKRDVRSGEFFMVEPTIGRTDYQEEVASLNGVNIPLAAYRTELGLSPIKAEVSGPMRVWRDRAADQRSTSLSDGARPWHLDGARIVDSLWRAYDPMPAAGPFVERAARRALRMVRGTRSRRRTNGSEV